MLTQSIYLTMCFDCSQINVILCFSFMEYFYTPHAFGINKQLNFKFLFIVSTLCNCYQVVSLFQKDSSFALGNSFIIYWQSKSTEKRTCLHLAGLWGLLNLSKIFKNRMRFYSYGSFFLNCKQFWGYFQCPKLYPLFSLSGVRASGSGLVQGTLRPWT